MIVRSAWWKLFSSVVRRITLVRMTPPVSSPPLANRVLRNRSGADGDEVFSGYSMAAMTSPVPSIMAVHGWASTTSGSLVERLHTAFDHVPCVKVIVRGPFDEFTAGFGHDEIMVGADADIARLTDIADPGIQLPVLAADLGRPVGR